MLQEHVDAQAVSLNEDSIAARTFPAPDGPQEEGSKYLSCLLQERNIWPWSSEKFSQRYALLAGGNLRITRMI
jgi:hypothetical protein